MIRLWNRVGLYRTLAVLLLVGAVAGGIAVAADRPTQQADAASGTTAADVGALDRAALERQDAQRADAERAARSDAQRKANEAAAAAADQAKASAKPSAKPGAGTKPGASKPNLPIPASCAASNFSGKNVNNKAIGCAELLAAGFGLDQMPCLDKLFTKESQWNPSARNSSSGAYGIPQSLPANKMASAGADYLTNPATQVRWGLTYIKGRYKTPCGAWAHSQSKGWY